MFFALSTGGRMDQLAPGQLAAGVVAGAGS
jgi:hypothetical protein